VVNKLWSCSKPAAVERESDVGLIQVDYCAYKPTENNIPFAFRPPLKVNNLHYIHPLQTFIVSAGDNNRHSLSRQLKALWN